MTNFNLQDIFWTYVLSVKTMKGEGEGEGEGEVAFFSAKRWDRRNRADLIESATPCHDAQMMGLYRDSNPLRLTILAAMSEDYTTAPQQLSWMKGSFKSMKAVKNHFQIDQYFYGNLAL